MGFYEKYILPCCLDKACSIGPIEKQRAKIIPFATGHVLEIGIGSGLNLPHYDPTKVEQITGVDPDEHIWKRSQTRRKAAQFPVERIGLSGEDIPMPTGSVDTVVVTYSLCTISDWSKLAGGCHSGRDIPDLIAQAGLDTTELHQGYIPGPKVLAYNYWGRAH